MRLKRACKKRPYFLLDGPLMGHTLWLTTASTMVMNIHGRRGRYAGTDRLDGLTWEEMT
jgi:hypothetical protein